MPHDRPSDARASSPDAARDPTQTTAMPAATVISAILALIAHDRKDAPRR